MNVYEVSVGGKIYKIETERAELAESASDQSVTSSSEIRWNVRLDGREIPVSCVPLDAGGLSLIINGESFDVHFQRTGESLQVLIGGKAYEYQVRDPRSLRNRKRTGANDAGEQKVTASMPGKVVRIIAAVGDQITEGQGILVIEAMKMQNKVRSQKNGQLKKLLVQQGANVVAGEVLAIIE
jgi:biotin carboxyl carrier protein